MTTRTFAFVKLMKGPHIVRLYRNLGFTVNFAVNLSSFKVDGHDVDGHDVVGWNYFVTKISCARIEDKL